MAPAAGPRPARRPGRPRRGSPPPPPSSPPSRRPAYDTAREHHLHARARPRPPLRPPAGGPRPRQRLQQAVSTRPSWSPPPATPASPCPGPLLAQLFAVHHTTISVPAAPAATALRRPRPRQPGRPPHQDPAQPPPARHRSRHHHPRPANQRRHARENAYQDDDTPAQHGQLKNRRGPYGDFSFVIMLCAEPVARRAGRMCRMVRTWRDGRGLGRRPSESWLACFARADLAALKRANAHFSDDLLATLLNEPLVGTASSGRARRAPTGRRGRTRCRSGCSASRRSTGSCGSVVLLLARSTTRGCAGGSAALWRPRHRRPRHQWRAWMPRRRTGRRRSRRCAAAPVRAAAGQRPRGGVGQGAGVAGQAAAPEEVVGDRFEWAYQVVRPALLEILGPEGSGWRTEKRPHPERPGASRPGYCSPKPWIRRARHSPGRTAVACLTRGRRRRSPVRRGARRAPAARSPDTTPGRRPRRTV